MGSSRQFRFTTCLPTTAQMIRKVDGLGAGLRGGKNIFRLFSKCQSFWFIVLVIVLLTVLVVVVPQVVCSVNMMLADVVQLPPGKLHKVLTRADAVRGPPGPGGAAWVNRMMYELKDVGVETARDFIEDSWNLNDSLTKREYGRLFPSTIKILCRLCCDAV